MNVESRRFKPYSFPESRLFEVIVYSAGTPKKIGEIYPRFYEPFNYHDPFTFPSPEVNPKIEQFLSI